MECVILCGLQASGKSSFCFERFRDTHIRLNYDMLKTRHREKILLEACREGKQSVVIDNTNATKDERSVYIERFKAAKFKIIGYYFQSKLEECLKRNAGRTGKACIPDIGLRSVFSKLELPTLAEGFDELYYVVIENGDFVVREWKIEGDS